MTARRTCTKCGVAYPCTAKHYAHSHDKWRTVCKHCDKARRAAVKAGTPATPRPWRGAKEAARDLEACWP